VGIEVIRSKNFLNFLIVSNSYYFTMCEIVQYLHCFLDIFSCP